MTKSETFATNEAHAKHADDEHERRGDAEDQVGEADLARALDGQGAWGSSQKRPPGPRGPV